MSIRLHSPEAMQLLNQDKATPKPCPCCGQQVTFKYGNHIQCPECLFAAPTSSDPVKEWNDLIDILEGNP